MWNPGDKVDWEYRPRAGGGNADPVAAIVLDGSDPESVRIQVARRDGDDWQLEERSVKSATLKVRTEPSRELGELVRGPVIANDYRDEITAKFLKAIENGNAPWMVSKNAEDIEGYFPINPVSGRPYNGINALHMMMSGHRDPRWCTAAQAATQGWKVRDGESGTDIEFVLGQEKREVQNPKTGEIEVEYVDLAKSEPFYVMVFNGEQIDGIPPYERTPAEWQVSQVAEPLLASTGVQLVHDLAAGDKGYYTKTWDEIHLPPKESYADVRQYYSKALSQMCYATGHPSRMNRETGKSFTSDEYAKEGLRASIAGLFLGYRLGLDFDRTEFAVYRRQCLSMLENDKNELFISASIAKRIAEQILAGGQAIAQEQEHDQPAPAQPAQQPVKEITREGDRVVLFVPYEERREAGKKGATFDRAKKQWWVPATVDLTPFQRWLQPPKPLTPEEIISQFRAALMEAKIDIDKETIVMDGAWHHLHVTSSTNKRKRSGSYVLNPTGIGYIKNHDTGYGEPWRPNGILVQDGKYEEFQRQAEANKQARDKAIQEGYERVAKRSTERWAKLQDATLHPYLLRKQIDGQGLKVWNDDLVVPLRDTSGRIWNLQTIPAMPGGQKLYQKEGRKQGLHLILGELEGAHTSIFCEGYATGWSLHKATGYPVVICFDAGNIQAVMQEIVAKYPDMDKIIGCDNDLVTPERAAKTVSGLSERMGYRLVTPADVNTALSTKAAVELGEGFALYAKEGPGPIGPPRMDLEIKQDGIRVHQVMVNNGGLEKAMQAAAATHAKAVAPKFQDPDAYQKGFKDFNDLAKVEGLDAVNIQLGAVVDLVKGRLHAERAAREVMPNLVEVLDPPRDGSAVGKVLVNAGSHTVQDIGRNQAMAHPVKNLDRVPPAGEKTRIDYTQGRGNVQEGKGRSQTRGR